VQIREFVVFGFWNFLGEREKKKKKKTRGRKKLTSLSLLSILQQRQRKQQQYQRAYRSICPSEWLEKWAEQREAGKSFPLLPPFFFKSRRRRPALEKGCPTTRISLVLFSTSTAQQQQKTLPLNRCVRRQVLDG